MEKLVFKLRNKIEIDKNTKIRRKNQLLKIVKNIYHSTNEENILIAGIPSKVVKRGVRWEK